MTERPVFTLQTRLRRLSDWDGRILPVIPDGVYGPNTHASIRSFQEAYSLPVTGETDLATWDAIARADSELLPKTLPPVTAPIWPPGQSVPPGAQHVHLYLVQAMLLALSQDYGELEPPQVTGLLDPATERGLKWLQKAAGLAETGELNTPTWHSLNDLYRTSTAGWGSR